MKKFILITEDLVYSFHTQAELQEYVSKYKITDYSISLLFLEVENGQTVYSN